MYVLFVLTLTNGRICDEADYNKKGKIQAHTRDLSDKRGPLVTDTSQKRVKIFSEHHRHI